jgi:glycosyltransferase involved in cell wall biosynthesis
MSERPALSILMVAEADPVRLEGGAERVLQQYSRRLAARGHAVTVVTRRDSEDLPAEETVAGVRVIRHAIADRDRSLDFIRSMLRECDRAVRTAASEQRFDVAMLFQPLSATAVLRSDIGSRLPTLYCFLSPWSDEYRVRRGMAVKPDPREYLLKPWVPLNTGLRRWTEKRAVTGADRLMALSEYSVGQLQNIHGLRGDNVSIIPGGVDTRRFAPRENRGGLRQRLRLPGGPLLLTVRNLEPRMGVDNLIRAWIGVRRNYPDAHLVIGGSGPSRKELEALAGELGLAGSVTFTGFIAEEDLPLYYATADCFVIPTRALEGFGLVTVESLACGTPVLGTPVGGTTEILRAFDPGFLFRDASPEAIADGIQARLPEILGDEPLRARCREFAVRSYDWEVVIGKLQSLFEDLIRQRGARRAA